MTYTKQKNEQRDEILVYVPQPASVFMCIVNLSGTSIHSNDKNHERVTKKFCFDDSKFLQIVRETDFESFTGIAFDIDYTRKAARGKLLKNLFEAIRTNKTLKEKSKFILLNLSWTNEFDETRKEDLSCKTRMEGPPTKRWRRQPAEVVKAEHENLDTELFKDIPYLLIVKHWSNDRNRNEMDIFQFEDKTVSEVAQSFENESLGERYYAVAKTTDAKMRLFQHIDSKLVVIMNTHSFVDGKADRNGSPKNIESVKGVGIKWRSPTIVMPNIQKLEFLKGFFEILQTGDFSHYNIVHVFTMSHGNKNDIMYTGDGESYNIVTEINKISANDKINSAIFYPVACRGKKYTISKPWATNLDMKEILNSRTCLNDRICIWRSTQEGYESPRNKVNGAVFVETIAEILITYKDKDEAISMLEFVSDVAHGIKERNRFEIMTEFNYNPNNTSVLESLIKASADFDRKNEVLFDQIKKLAKHYNLPIRIISY